MAPRILVVDDDCGLRQLFGLVLQHEGFEVIQAAGGAEALARVRDSDPTLVLLDVMMPDMTGYDVCRRLRNDHRTRQLPVVFCSVMDDVKQHNDAWQVGADDCLRKPFKPDELVARLRNVMERRGIITVTP